MCGKTNGMRGTHERYSWQNILTYPKRQGKAYGGGRGASVRTQIDVLLDLFVLCMPCFFLFISFVFSCLKITPKAASAPEPVWKPAGFSGPPARPSFPLVKGCAWGCQATTLVADKRGRREWGNCKSN